MLRQLSLYMLNRSKQLFDVGELSLKQVLKQQVLYSVERRRTSYLYIKKKEQLNRNIGYSLMISLSRTPDP